jgi:hypothetical protein
LRSKRTRVALELKTPHRHQTFTAQLAAAEVPEALAHMDRYVANLGERQHCETEGQPSHDDLIRMLTDEMIDACEGSDPEDRPFVASSLLWIACNDPDAPDLAEIVRRAHEGGYTLGYITTVDETGWVESIFQCALSGEYLLPAPPHLFPNRAMTAKH